MKKSEFIKQVLEHQENTVFTSEGTIEAAVDLFIELGMLVPECSLDPSGIWRTWENEGDS